MCQHGEKIRALPLKLLGADFQEFLDSEKRTLPPCLVTEFDEVVGVEWFPYVPVRALPNQPRGVLRSRVASDDDHDGVRTRLLDLRK
jgi:hypothetical protein